MRKRAAESRGKPRKASVYFLVCRGLLLPSMAFCCLPLSAVAAGVQGPAMPRHGRVVNLECVETLIGIGEPELAGVFTFIADGDSAPALADLLVHKEKDLKRFIHREKKMLKKSGAIPQWDHDVAGYALSIYANPPAGTPEPPSKSVMKDLVDLYGAPAVSSSPSRAVGVPQVGGGR